jgi:hypothetical protein
MALVDWDAAARSWRAKATKKPTRIYAGRAEDVPGMP